MLRGKKRKAKYNKIFVTDCLMDMYVLYDKRLQPNSVKV